MTLAVDSGLPGAAVRRLLPHRYPMLLVDRVLEVVPGERLTAVKAVTCNEPCYARLGTDATEAELAYPQVLLVESWGQAAGLLAVFSRPNPDVLTGEVMLAGAMTGLEFHRPVRPGDVVRHEVRLFRALTDTVLFEGESRVGDDVAVTFSRMVMAFRPAAQLRTNDPPVPAATG
jgi:3-hydroxyacyl-[acyl-carrier-protein] dehydratase